MKHYYIRYPRNFANEYDLVWIESTDTESITRALEEGFDRITRKEAYRKVSGEKYARKNDQAFSGFGGTVILPYNAANLPDLEHDIWNKYFEREDNERGTLRCYCDTHSDININLYSDDGIVFYPIVRRVSC